MGKPSSKGDSCARVSIGARGVGLSEAGLALCFEKVYNCNVSHILGEAKVLQAEKPREKGNHQAGMSTIVVVVVVKPQEGRMVRWTKKANLPLWIAKLEKAKQRWEKLERAPSPFLWHFRPSIQGETVPCHERSIAF